MTATAIQALAAASLVAALGFGGTASAADEVSVFVPYLKGPAGLSASVTTVLGIQVWQTLRQVDSSTPRKDFGRGTVKSFAVKPPPESHQVAEALARDARVLSQMILWGTLQEYGGGVIVQAFLSIPEYSPLNESRYADFRTKHEEEWVIRIPVKDGEAVFRVDLPRRRFAFEPIVVPRQVIENYSKLGSLALYDPKNPAKPIGSVGNAFVALEQRGDLALVRSGKVTGLVRLPHISKNRSEIVEFVGGLIRVFRGDWVGAIELFALVLKNTQSATDLRIDSHLYMAMAHSKLGRPGHVEIAHAFELNPYLDRTATYAVMERLQLYHHMTQTGASLGERRSMISQTRGLIERYRRLFVADDPWVNQVLSGLSRIETAYFR